VQEGRQGPGRPKDLPGLICGGDLRATGEAAQQVGSVLLFAVECKRCGGRARVSAAIMRQGCPVAVFS
jgi:hypothetical protein